MKPTYQAPFTLYLRADESQQTFSTIEELKRGIACSQTSAGWFVDDANGKSIAGGYMGWGHNMIYGDSGLTEEML